MQEKRVKDRLAPIRARVSPQMGGPLQTRRARQISPLTALQSLESHPGFPRDRALSAPKSDTRRTHDMMEF